ncbi:MAG: exonuclease SbcCD subunit D [Promethearchaeota archaeon]
MEPVKYVHIADLHLGKKQYNLEERYQDNLKAFKWILDLSIREQVDFILISGDLFDNKKIGPSVLSEVYELITRFQLKCKEKLNREIKIICIEGNHDNPIFSSRSWMSFLADLELIILLNGKFDKNTRKVSFQNYSSETHRGGMIQIKDCRIYGFPYYGSFTESLFPSIYNAIDADNSKFNILMMHFGINGYDKRKPGVLLSDNLKKLSEKVDYLALGHYHKFYNIPDSEPWIFNPGSMETMDIYDIPNPDDDEKKRGAILCNITGKKKYQRENKLWACDNGDSDPNFIPNRRFYSITMPIDISITESFNQAIDLIITKIKNYGIPLKKNNPNISKDDLNTLILVFSIKGKELKYSRLEINFNQLRKNIIDEFAVLDVRIYGKELSSVLDSFKSNKMTIDEIEREVFLALIEGNPQFKERKEQILALMNDLKTEMMNNKPNYVGMEKQIKQWSKLNIEEFKKIEDQLLLIDNETIETNQALPGDTINEIKSNQGEYMLEDEDEDEDEYEGIAFYQQIDDGEDEDKNNDFEVF